MLPSDLSFHIGPRLPSEKLPSRSQSVISDISLPTNSGASFETGHPRLPQLLLSFPLKALWVFQDRKRFDNVIEQLDFLLSNLEKISETLQGRREMPHSNTSKQGWASSGRNHTETQEKHDYRCKLYITPDMIEFVVQTSSGLPVVLLLIQVSRGTLSLYSHRRIRDTIC